MSTTPTVCLFVYFLVLKWGIYWCPHSLTAMWASGLALRRDSHQLDDWPYHTGSFNSCPVLQYLIRKKITWLTHNQTMRVITAIFLALQATEVYTCPALSSHVELCALFLLIALPLWLVVLFTKTRSSVFVEWHEQKTKEIWGWWGEGNCHIFRVRPY